MISDGLILIADSFGLALSKPTNLGPTRFSDTDRESNSVIDLMFLRCDSVELDNHSILPDSRLSSDHAPLLIEIPIGDEIIHSLSCIIPLRSEQEKGFIEDIISNLKSIDTSNIEDTTCLDHIVN